MMIYPMAVGGRTLRLGGHLPKILTLELPNSLWCSVLHHVINAGWDWTKNQRQVYCRCRF